MAEWEAAATNVPKSTRVVIIRTGIVLARDGGVLARMLPIFELFAGKRDACTHTHSQVLLSPVSCAPPCTASATASDFAASILFGSTAQPAPPAEGLAQARSRT